MPGTTTLIYTGYATIICLSLLGLIRDQLPYSLNKLFWIFCLLFFGIAPTVQYASNLFPFEWVQNQQNSASFIATNNLIIACMVLFGAVQYIFQRGHKKSKLQLFEFEENIRFIHALGILIVAASIQLMISPSWWVRLPKEEANLLNNQSLQLLADKGSKGLMLGVSLLAVAAYRKRALSPIQIIIIACVILIANFPTAIPRYWFACLYLGVGISFFSKMLVVRKRMFEAAMLAGLLILFPLLSLVRVSSRPHLSSTQIFCAPDFDAYASLRNTLLYTEANGYTQGRQVATTFLFFIPRSSWQNKSIGTGALVNPPRPGSDFHNFASPLPAEGYIDFGLIGALAWIALFAVFTGWYDRLYWRGKNKGFIRLFYPAYLGLFFFTLRGDLLSSFAYSTGIALFAFIGYKILHPRQT